MLNKPVGVLSTRHAQQQQNVRRASSGISWAAELQLQEPEDEDVGQRHHDFHSHPPLVYTAVVKSPAVAALELQPGQQWRAGAAEDMVAAGLQTSEMQRERLNAYYRQKAAAEHAAYLDAKLYAEQVEQQTAQQQRQQSERGVAKAFSMHAEPSAAPRGPAANADSVLQRLREVKAMASSLSLPKYGSASLPQSELEGLSPGLPGLQSQLSKMMQEVSQARNEVLGLRSELDHSSLVSHKSGNFGAPGSDAAW